MKLNFMLPDKEETCETKLMYLKLLEHIRASPNLSAF